MVALQKRHPLFHPVIELPAEYAVFDLTKHVPEEEVARFRYGVGRYDERRSGTYQTALFAEGRDVHVGVDLFAPVGTPVHAFEDGKVHLFAYNAAPGDYGYTLITEHRYGGLSLYALHGHLSARSIEGKVPGQPIRKGEVIAWVGDRQENGGWIPHLHFQLSYERPGKPDLPGVVAEADRAWALLRFPDPRLVLGQIY